MTYVCTTHYNGFGDIATSLSESLFIEDADEEEGNSNIGGGMAEKNKIQ